MTLSTLLEMPEAWTWELRMLVALVDQGLIRVCSIDQLKTNIHPVYK